MLEHLSLIRNIGQFDNVSEGAHLPLQRLSVVYAENGRGKTTIAEILRSSASGDALILGERHRLAAANAPHVVLRFAGATHMFQNGAWSAALPEVAVFNDSFVAENVCSGIEIGSDHRQNLHELILGTPGVALNSALKALVDRIETHNRELRVRGDAIPAVQRGAMSVENFCALEADTTIAEKIEETERALAAARSADSVRDGDIFSALTLPSFDLDMIERLITSSLEELEERTVARVKAHAAVLGDGGEQWIESGVMRIARASEAHDNESCPFCNQALEGSDIVESYRRYFGDAYRGLLADLETGTRAFEEAHGGDIASAFERSVRVAVERARFWSPFAEVPPINLDTAEIARRWNVARDLLRERLQAKRAAPLDQLELANDVRDAVHAYEETVAAVAALSEQLLSANAGIAIAKERALAGNAVALSVDLSRYRAVRDRYSAETAPLCDAYLEERRAKADTETERVAARAALDNYREQVFPAYEQAINDYLRRFNAGFRLGSVESINNRGGSSCAYNVVIGTAEVAVANDVPGQPSFRTTLSAGDRNALALAFFFASLDRDAGLADKIVVIDDPMTSLDEHRSLTTVQEILRLVPRVRQVIVLSHSKPFLCALWNSADRTARSAIKIARAPVGSTLANWDVTQDMITDHDKRHAKVRAFLAAEPNVDAREVASALRPMLEAYCRVAYPGDFPPESLLGPFIGICEQRLAVGQTILNRADTDELRALLDYANLFHHDTNLAYETAVINDAQLVGFAERALAFMRRT